MIFSADTGPYIRSPREKEGLCCLNDCLCILGGRLYIVFCGRICQIFETGKKLNFYWKKLIKKIIVLYPMYLKIPSGHLVQK